MKMSLWITKGYIVPKYAYIRCLCLTCMLNTEAQGDIVLGKCNAVVLVVLNDSVYLALFVGVERNVQH